jgi:hypothetical protein
MRAAVEGEGLPGFWEGHGVLPRVAQRGDALIALHRMPEDDWMGFTHAYFPVYAFDEVAIGDRWAFARSGDGYLALYASQGMSLIKEGPHAYRELRSEGTENVWIVQMGRAAVDGSFSDFQEQVLALAVDVNGLEVQFETLRGEHLAFGWRGPLVRGGQGEAIVGVVDGGRRAAGD